TASGTLPASTSRKAFCLAHVGARAFDDHWLEDSLFRYVRSAPNQRISRASPINAVIEVLAMRTAFALLLALAISGCASQTPDRPLSLKGPPQRRTAAPEPASEQASKCADRHLDHQAGRPPGGATNLEQKERDDRACGEEYRYPGYLKRN